MMPGLLLALLTGHVACQEAAGNCETCQATATGSNSLLQARSKRESVVQVMEETEDPPAIWFAHPYGNCLAECGPKKFRDVECLSVYGGHKVHDSACKGPQPASAASCVCPGIEACESTQAACPLDNGGTDPAIGFEEVGCFEFDEQPFKKGKDEPDDTPRDYFCIDWDEGKPCRSGVPFYALDHEPMHAEKCFKFCTSKGMDIFGIEGGEMCRCGATVLNKEVWHEDKPRKGLAFKPDQVKRAHAPQGKPCPLKVFRYTGHMESDGVPPKHWDIKEQDLQYTDSIVTGRYLDEGQEEDGLPGEGVGLEQEEEGATEEGESQKPGFDRPCWPNKCGPGRGPWRTRQTFPPAGVSDNWKEYVMVNYAFEPGLDKARKEAFRKAVETWSNHTCINLMEQPSQPSGPHIMVGAYSASSCYLSGMGHGTSRINLGWCNSMRALGSMIHEIGHAIGMNHEQKRPDATKNYHGHGPFLKMYWQHIPSQWVPQYTPDSSSYTGSANDGPGDAHSGWAEYNFGSIMHYYGGNRYDTFPPEKERLVGNRKTLTAGDIEQILDIYQCKKRCTTDPCPTPAPTPAPTPVPTPPPTPPTPAPPVNYELRKTGRCASHIASTQECAQAAKELGLSDTTVSDDRQTSVSYDPPYCYYEGRSLKFNKSGKNTGGCTSSDNCLCSLMPTPAPTPAPPTPPVSATGKCGFESGSEPYCGIWTNSRQDQFDWTRRSGGTPSSGTGPPGAASGRYYLYIETSCPRRSGQVAILESKPLTIAAGTSMSFSYHMYGSNIATLKVLVGRQTVFEMKGNKGNGWRKASVDMSQFASKQEVVKFFATRGSSYRGDIAIDDVGFSTLPTGPSTTKPPPPTKPTVSPTKPPPPTKPPTTPPPPTKPPVPTTPPTKPPPPTGPTPVVLPGPPGPAGPPGPPGPVKLVPGPAGPAGPPR